MNPNTTNLVGSPVFTRLDSEPVLPSAPEHEQAEFERFEDLTRKLVQTPKQPPAED